MDVHVFLLVNLLNALTSALLLGVSFWLFKRFTFGKHYNKILMEKGVSGGAIVLGCFLIAMGFAIGFSSF